MAGDDEKDKGAAASEPQQNNARSLQVLAQPPPPFMQSPGEPIIPYVTWIRMYQNFELLAGIRELDEPLRKAYFVSSLGSEGQRTFFNLEVRDDTTEAAMLAVQAHYVAQSCEETERYRFKCRKQLSGESIDDFVADLRRLVVGCNYAQYGGTCEKDMMRDQIVEKCCDERIREKLLLRATELRRQSKRMSLEETISIVKSAETVKREATVMSGGEPSSSNVNTGTGTINKVGKRYSGSFETRCEACNIRGHKSDDAECKAKSRLCNTCKERGHYAGSKLCKGEKREKCNVAYTSPPYYAF